MRTLKSTHSMWIGNYCKNLNKDPQGERYVDFNFPFLPRFDLRAS